MRKKKEIIENQKTFKDNILEWLADENRKAKRELSKINSKDVFVQEEKKKLQKKFKAIECDKVHEKLFYKHPKRNKELYAWWDTDTNEVIICKYE